MHSGNPIAGRCIHCAFRLHQSILRARRLNLVQRSFTQGRASFLHLNLGPRRHTSRADGHAPIRFQKGASKRQPAVDDPFASNFDSPPHEAIPSAQNPSFGAIRRTPRARPREPHPDGPFDVVLQNRLRIAKEELRDIPLLAQLRKEAKAAGGKADSFEKIWRRFMEAISPNSATLPDTRPFPRGDANKAENVRALVDALRVHGQSGLDNRIRYLFYAHLTNARFTPSDIRNQRILADLRYPSEWFPGTRAIHRKIHLHVGPTNSGKTYHALKRLQESETGVYAGPLRLLAHEVYSRLNAKGKACSLLTGEERRLASREQGVEENKLFSCTVEMMPLNFSMDVAVIDEIQMIGSAERGWAWTQALLGAKAREVHLCGEERTVPLIRQICASLGEKLEVHHYERLTPLKVADSSLKGTLRNLKKGDCVVSFSVMGIHALRRQIERATGKKVATVYGSLPPETRAQQARLFNDPNNDYDYLVASDAVGMGLNLAIKRIVFEHTSKFDGYERRPLGVADLKQIAGRAGRYRVAGVTENESEKKVNTSIAAVDTTEDMHDLATPKGEPPPPLSSHAPSTETAPTPTSTISSPSSEMDTESTGLVTTLEDFDFPLVQSAMASSPPPLTTAGIFPPASVLERFSAYFPPSTPFSYVLTRLHELSQMHSRFHLCGLRDQVWIADLIEPVQGLSVADRLIICNAPASKSDKELWSKLMPAYARCIAQQSTGELTSIPELPLEILEAEISASREYLRALEQLHKGIVCYLWLSFRFGGVFTTRAVATHAKGLVEARIEDVLSRFSFTEAERKKLVEKREKQVLESLEGGNMTGSGMAEAAADEARAVFDEGEVEGKESGAVELRPEETAEDRLAGEEDMPFDDPVEGDVFARERADRGDNLASDAPGEASDQPRQSGYHDHVAGEITSDISETINKLLYPATDANTAPRTNNTSAETPVIQSTYSIKGPVALQQPKLAEHENRTTAAPEDGEVRLADQRASTATEDLTPISHVEEHPADGPSQPDSRSQSPPVSGVPPKHLHTHLDVEVKEVGTDAASRP